MSRWGNWIPWAMNAGALLGAARRSSYFSRRYSKRTGFSSFNQNVGTNGRPINMKRNRRRRYYRVGNRGYSRRGWKSSKAIEVKWNDQVLTGSDGPSRYPTVTGTVHGHDYHKMRYDGDILDNTGAVVLNNGFTIPYDVQAGTGPEQRIGRKIMISSIQGNFTLAPNFDGTHKTISNVDSSPFIYGPQNAVVRVILLLDTQNNSQTDAAWDLKTLLDTTTSGTVYGVNSISPYNIDYAGRYKIIFDKIVHVDQDNGFRVTFKFYKKFKTVIRYTGITGTTSEKPTNNFRLLFLTGDDFSDAYANYPSIRGFVRTRYVDM